LFESRFADAPGSGSGGGMLASDLSAADTQKQIVSDAGSGRSYALDRKSLVVYLISKISKTEMLCKIWM
jgi:hypothetical protein